MFSMSINYMTHRGNDADGNPLGEWKELGVVAPTMRAAIDWFEEKYPSAEIRAINILGESMLAAVIDG